MTVNTKQITNNFELFSKSKQQQLRAASTTTLRPPRPRLDGPIMGPMVMATRLITTVDAGTAGVPYASCAFDFLFRSVSHVCALLGGGSFGFGAVGGR